MNDKFPKDLCGFYGHEGESFVKRILKTIVFKYVALFRKTRSADSSLLNTKGPVFSALLNCKSKCNACLFDWLFVNSWGQN